MVEVWRLLVRFRVEKRFAWCLDDELFIVNEADTVSEHRAVSHSVYAAKNASSVPAASTLLYGEHAISCWWDILAALGLYHISPMAW